MSEELKALRTAAETFCAANLRECCAELNEWRTKGKLRDGKLRELGTMCERYVGCHDGLKNAEAMVDFQACALVATPPSPSTASEPPAREAKQSIGDDPAFRELLDEFAYRASERRAMGGDFGSAEADELAESALIAYIDGRTAGAAPEGYVLAPKEATEAMVHAAQDVPPPRMFGVVYRAMIAAAPAPTNTGTEEAHADQA